jgi:hypothetical protein
VLAFGELGVKREYRALRHERAKLWERPDAFALRGREVGYGLVAEERASAVDPFEVEGSAPEPEQLRLSTLSLDAFKEL